MKVYYEGITFDSELEVEYYKYLYDLLIENKVKAFYYHPAMPIAITNTNGYTPDFVVVYDDRIEIIETKGYNQYSYLRDSIIHNYMLNLPQAELKKWLELNDYVVGDKQIVYKKIKYLNKFGWVDFDFKNPNTLANKRKEKIVELTAELKELRQFKKDTIRYWKLFIKSIAEPKKVTKSQEEFMNKYAELIDKLVKEDDKK